jgi:cytochrome c553
MNKIFIAMLISLISSPSLNASVEMDDKRNLFSGAADQVSASIFNETCMGCHSGGVPRAPHSTTFAAMSADYILNTLNGIMSSQSSGLTKIQKVKLAEFITGSKVSKNLPEPYA